MQLAMGRVSPGHWEDAEATSPTRQVKSDLHDVTWVGAEGLK